MELEHDPFDAMHPDNQVQMPPEGAPIEDYQTALYKAQLLVAAMRLAHRRAIQPPPARTVYKWSEEHYGRFSDEARRLYPGIPEWNDPAPIPMSMPDLDSPDNQSDTTGTDS